MLVKCETAKRFSKKRKNARDLDVHNGAEKKSEKLEAHESGGGSGDECVPADVPNYERPFPPFDIARVAYLRAAKSSVRQKLKAPKVNLL